MPLAIRFAKEAQTQHQSVHISSEDNDGLRADRLPLLRRSSTFLDKMNAELFAPHGLFAMVMTFNPEQPSQIISVVDTVSPLQVMQSASCTSFGRRGGIQNAQNTTCRELQLPPASPLVFPDTERLPPTNKPKNTLLKMGDFIADDNDRRAQARCVILPLCLS